MLRRFNHILIFLNITFAFLIVVNIHNIPLYDKVLVDCIAKQHSNLVECGKVYTAFANTSPINIATNILIHYILYTFCYFIITFIIFGSFLVGKEKDREKIQRE